MQNEQCVHVVQHLDAQLCTALCKWRTSFSLTLYSCYNSPLNQIKSTVLLPLTLRVLWILRCFRAGLALYVSRLLYAALHPLPFLFHAKAKLPSLALASWSPKWCMLLRAMGFGMSAQHQGRGSSELTQASLPQILHKHPTALSRQENQNYPDRRVILFLKNGWFILWGQDATFLCTNVLRRLQRDGWVREPLFSFAFWAEQHRRCVNTYTHQFPRFIALSAPTKQMALHT